MSVFLFVLGFFVGVLVKGKIVEKCRNFLLDKIWKKLELSKIIEIFYLTRGFDNPSAHFVGTSPYTGEALGEAFGGKIVEKCRNFLLDKESATPPPPDGGTSPYTGEALAAQEALGTEDGWKRLEVILRNIENYDGTGRFQADVPGEEL